MSEASFLTGSHHPFPIDRSVTHSVEIMTSAAHLRPATTADHERLGHLLRRSYGTLLIGYYTEAELKRVLPLITRPQSALLQSPTYYVVECYGALAACGGWTMATPGTAEVVPGVGHIRHFATNPDYLRRGFAATILRRCQNDATSAGLSALSCWSTVQAVAFYRSQGFERRRTVDVLLTPDTEFAAVEMICKL